MVKQWVEKTAAKDANWLIGEDCFMPDKKGIALRNMKSPGTAYKNERGVSHL
jgi:Zn-dependent metalloprotease